VRSVCAALVADNGAPYRQLGLLSVTRLTFTLTGATLRQVGHVAGGCLFIGDAEPTSLDMAGAVVFRVTLTSGETFDGEVTEANRLGRQPASDRSGSGLTSHVRQEATTTADLSPPSRNGPLIWTS